MANLITIKDNEQRLIEVAGELSEVLSERGGDNILKLQEFGWLFARIQLERIRREMWDNAEYSASRRVQERINALPGGVA